MLTVCVFNLFLVVSVFERSFYTQFGFGVALFLVSAPDDSLLQFFVGGEEWEDGEGRTGERERKEKEGPREGEREFGKGVENIVQDREGRRGKLLHGRTQRKSI